MTVHNYKKSQLKRIDSTRRGKKVPSPINGSLLSTFTIIFRQWFVELQRRQRSSAKFRRRDSVADVDEQQVRIARRNAHDGRTKTG